MTRDEAIGVLVRNAAPCFPHMQESEMQPLCGAEVDAWVELGILTLDGPDIDEGSGHLFKIRKFMRNFHLQNFSPSQLEGALSAAGLKIVEK